MLRFTILILFILLCNPSFAQNTDSLLQFYNNAQDQEKQFTLLDQLVTSHLNVNKIDSAWHYADLAIDYTKAIKKEDQQYQILNHFIGYYQHNSSFDQLDSLLDISLTLAIPKEELVKIHLKKFGIKVRKSVVKDEAYPEDLINARELIGNDTTSEIMGEYYYHLGRYNYEKRNYLKAVDNLEHAKTLFASSDFNVVKVNTTLASVYSALGLFENALELQKNNLEFLDGSDDIRGKLFTYFGLINTFSQLNRLQDVKTTSFTALEFSNKNNIKEAIGFVYSLLGKTLIAEGQLDSAIYYAKIGEMISIKQDEKKERTDNQLILSRAYHQKNQIDSALHYARLASQYTFRSETDDIALLAQIFEDGQDTLNAYKMLKQSNIFALDQLNSNNKTTAKIIESSIDQAVKERDREYKQQLINQKMYAIFTILLIVVLALVAISYIQSSNNKELKNLNESLENRNEALKQFAYITSHDLKEPIRNINSFTQILSRNIGKLDEEKQKKYLTYINNGSKTLYEIVTALQTFTKVQFNRIERENVIIEEVFSTVRNNLASFIAERNGKVIFENPEQIKEIQFAKSMLVLVLQNLVQNGLKYNQSTIPEVKVLLQKQEGKFLFSVIDNGEGIAQKYFDNIFKPFKTLQNKSLIKSSGLGLSICKNIVESYNGKIWLSSESGKGSCFYVLI